MSGIKLTKMELRLQQLRLQQLQKYLPTLQLKKAMLQLEVYAAQKTIVRLSEERRVEEERVAHYDQLFSDSRAATVLAVAKVHEINRRWETIAGIDVPIFDQVVFMESTYDLFDTPAWWDVAVDRLRELMCCTARVQVAEEKKGVLEGALREVSIRVNLFEKRLIPRAKENITRIKVFLSDQQLAAVAQAKVAKRKIEERATLWTPDQEKGSA